ncbi:hypothetical protein [Streptomyces sp. NPDC055186]
MSDEGEPSHWGELRRARLRAEPDARFFRLYGISTEEADCIPKTFQSESESLKNNKIAESGE